MSEKEKTFERVSEYSLWHRSLGREFVAVDVDWVEWRENRGIVALICTTANLKDENHLVNSKPFIFKRIGLEVNIIRTIAKSLNVPAYYVIHTNDLNCFHVYTIVEDGLVIKSIMNKEEYAHFITNL